LAQFALDAGLVSGEMIDIYNKISSDQADLRKRLKESFLYPTPATQVTLNELGTAVLSKPASFEEMLRREEVSCSTLSAFGTPFDYDYLTTIEPVEIEIKYSGYIQRQNDIIEQSIRLESMEIPKNLDYQLVAGLSREEIEKLTKLRPNNLGQVGRISGVNPSALQAIMLFLKARDRDPSLNLS
jgi:tRNA uridine 5-carboxymethylaminomethyl modification enzyme